MMWSNSFYLIIYDNAFSTEIGLEFAVIAGSVHCLLMSDSSAKIRNKKDRRGFVRCLSDA